jgi:ferredoxin-type protein NapG
MKPEIHPCRLCKDLPCIKACPSGALVTPAKEVPAMASVRFLQEKCLNTEGVLCDACEGSCPPQIAALKMKGPFSKRVPEIDLQRCVGCGLCAYYCEEQGNALKIEAIRAF